MARYLNHLFIALDQCCTALLGGWPDETLSSCAYRLQQQGRPLPLPARGAERLRYQLPPELR